MSLPPGSTVQVTREEEHMEHLARCSASPVASASRMSSTTRSLRSFFRGLACMRRPVSRDAASIVRERKPPGTVDRPRQRTVAQAADGWAPFNEAV